jgi:hypothetical protein
MASSKEAASQNGEQAAGKVKLEGEALRDAIKKQVWLFVLHKAFLSDVKIFSPIQSRPAL